MTETCDSWVTSPYDAELLLRDLARVSGTLSEIATVWRRALPYLPDLPLILPIRLQDSALQLAAAIRAAADAGRVQPDNLALSLPDQLSELKHNTTAAQAITCRNGLQIGDGRLWESLNAALTQAAGRSPFRLRSSRDIHGMILDDVEDGHAKRPGREQWRTVDHVRS